MKNLVLSSMLLFSVSLCEAQNDSLKKNYKWEVSASLASVEPITEAGFFYIVAQTRIFDDADHRKDLSSSFGLKVSHRVKDHFSVRFCMGLTNYSIHETWDQRESVASFNSIDYLLDTGYTKEKVLIFSTDFLWNSNYKKIIFYGGFQNVFRKFNPLTTHLKYSLLSFPNDSLKSVNEYEFNSEGGFAIGVGAIAGFKINVVRNFSIGAELSNSFSYYKSGGEIGWYEHFPLNPSNNFEASMQETYQGYKFSSLTSSINISLKF